jgi:hypothetical protein
VRAVHTVLGDNELAVRLQGDIGEKPDGWNLDLAGGAERRDGGARRREPHDEAAPALRPTATISPSTVFT